MGIDDRPIVCTLDIEEALGFITKTGLASSHGSVLQKSASTTDAVKRRPATASRSASNEDVVVRVFREGAEVDIRLSPSLLTSDDDSELMLWAGIVLRSTPRCIFERAGESVADRASGVFAQRIMRGSPADARDIMPFWFLLEVDDRKIQKLADVLEATRHATSDTRNPGSGDRRWVRLRVLDLNGQERVIALQCDPLFFPTLLLQHSESGRWQCAQY